MTDMLRYIPAFLNRLERSDDAQYLGAYLVRGGNEGNADISYSVGQSIERSLGFDAECFTLQRCQIL